MRKEEFGLMSCDGNTVLHVVWWIPDGAVKGIVQIVHGMKEYIERYTEFAEYLSRNHILVVGYDLLGHGGSVRTRNEYGYFADLNGNMTMIRDMRAVQQCTVKEYRHIPYFMLGQGMGSFFVRQFICLYGSEVDGALLLGTGCYTKMTVAMARLFCRMEAGMFGWHYRDRFFNNHSGAKYNHRFHGETTADWRTKDSDLAQAFMDDVYCDIPFTLNAYYNILKGLGLLTDRVYLMGMSRYLPILIASGEEDPLCKRGRSLHRLRRQLLRIGMKRVDCKVYPGDRHEILNETDREDVYRDLLDWINSAGQIEEDA